MDDRWIEYDIAFHRKLVDASDISPLASFCDLLQAFFHKFREDMGGVRKGREAHCQIVEVLQAGRLEAATELLRNHLSFYEKSEMPLSPA